MSIVVRDIDFNEIPNFALATWLPLFDRKKSFDAVYTNSLVYKYILWLCTSALA